ncbi:MAG: hypothetical protein CVU56_12235 [Deltaproteobacteria bacterium HGW-Deltaproteobacteria-14]|jgi:TolA-binding protein|nr:MAG: hypothetical protein CVU56_12235 [Deltaproteobacteria bacterium HGW-Deltaproteobacteria-14]
MSRDKLAETEEAWFNDDFGDAGHHDPHDPRTRSSAIDGRTRTQLAVLAAAAVVTFVAGLALGAFSGHASPDPAPTPAAVPATPTPAQQAALDAAAQWSGTTLLAEDALSLSLDDLLAERRIDAAPVPVAVDADPTSDVGAPGEDPPAEEKTEPVIAKAAAEKATVAKTPVEQTPVARAPAEKRPVVAKAPVEKAPVEKAPVEKAPVEKAPAPVEKAPVEKVPVEKAPGEKAPVEATAPPSADAKDAAATALADAKGKAASRDWKGAVAAYSAALAATPGDAKALVGRGQAYFELKQTDLAAKDLEAVLARNPTHATALLTLGSIAQDQGKKAAARDYYERYLKRYPNGRRAAEVRALLDGM